MAVTCLVCLLERDPPERATAADGALLAVATETRESDLCPLHRLDVRRVRRSAEHAVAHRAIDRFARVALRKG